MATLKTVEAKIRKIEGFTVHFLQDHNGRNIRSNKKDIPQYQYARQAKNSYTVSSWRKARFSWQYPGFDVAILDGDGNRCHGGTKLSTVRDSYLD